jgi:WXG100 family type VII secretion target
MPGLTHIGEGAYQGPQQLRDAADELRQNLQRVLQTAEGLQGSWKGRGGVAFQTLNERWNADGLKLQNILNEIADNMDTGFKRQNATDEQTASSMSKITQMLG